MTESRRHLGPRRGGGIFVLLLLTLVFFSILGLMVLYWPRNTPEPVALDETLYVVPLELKLRTQPTNRGAVLGRARRGETITLLEASGSWARVQKQDGLQGWVERNAIEGRAERERRIEKAEAIRALPSLRGVVERSTELFAGPGIFYPDLGPIARGVKVNVHARDHDFYAIDIDGELAWVEADAVDLSETAGARFEVAATGWDEAPAPMEEILPAEHAPEEIPLLEPPATISSEPLASGIYAVVPPGGTEPQLVHRVTPAFPLAARRAGIEGPVIIRAIVRRDGTVDSAEILRDLPLGLGEAAREAVEQWRFRPATVEGQPIDVYYTVTVNYALTAR